MFSISCFTQAAITTPPEVPLRKDPFPDNISPPEWVPFSPKNSTYMYTDDMRGTPVLSYCTRPHKSIAAGTRGQKCFPAFVWINICSKGLLILDVQTVGAHIINDDYHWENTNPEDVDWRKTCFKYDLTWPYCISKKEAKDFCKAWRRIPRFQRQYIKLFVKHMPHF